MRPMTHSLRKKIRIRIKNRQDISDLIKDVDIKKENLNRAIISSFDAIHRDISGTTFVNAVIGEKNKEIHMHWCTAYHSSFKDTTFLGRLFLKNADMRHTSFVGCTILGGVEYQHSDLRGCNLCDALWTVGSRAGHGCKVDKSLIDRWGLKIE